MLSTAQIMRMALAMVDMEEIPGDSAIYYPGENIKKLLFGIDIGAAELVLAKQAGYDAVVAHHPPQVAAIPAWQVYLRHREMMIAAGLPPQAADEAVLPRVEAMCSAYQSANHDHYPSLARLLDLPFMNIHCPLDELGRRIMQKTVDDCLTAAGDASLGDVAAALKNLPEFQSAATEIEIALGNAHDKAGSVVVAHGALTNGGYAVANAYFQHGIDTVIYIHIPYQDLMRLRQEARGQLLISGHISSDLVGINPFVEKLRAAGLTVDTISGIK